VTFGGEGRIRTCEG